jgi:hypothetical protein
LLQRSSGLEGNRLLAKQERDELTRWGLSLLDLFHTLQIYKPGVSR